MRISLNIVITVLTLALILTASSLAQVKIKTIDPYLKEKKVAVDALVEGIFNQEEIEETLKSGLPVILELEVVLTEENEKKEVAYRSLDIEMVYDVWSEIYTINHDGKFFFKTEVFEELQSATAVLSGFVVASVADLKADRSYVILIRPRVNPISKRESKKLKDWLNENIEEVQRTESREFELNLGAVIEWFLGLGKKKSKSKWYQSVPFKPTDLEVRK